MYAAAQSGLKDYAGRFLFGIHYELVEVRRNKALPPESTIRKPQGTAIALRGRQRVAICARLKIVRELWFVGQAFPIHRVTLSNVKSPRHFVEEGKAILRLVFELCIVSIETFGSHTRVSLA